MTSATKAFSDSEYAADAFLVAVLKGDRDLPELSDAGAAVVAKRALHHGVTALLVAQPSSLENLPSEIQYSLRAEALGQTMWDLRHREILIPLLTDLQEAQVPNVLLKGTALAYGLYRSPALRPRGDTDLLVPIEYRDIARELLLERGFVLDKPRRVQRSTQEGWHFTADGGSNHAIDIHWHLLSAWSLASLLETTEIITRSDPIQALCTAARRLSLELSLIHACLHRAAHVNAPYFVDGDVQFGGDRLIWFYDMHLLSMSMKETCWQSFKNVTSETKTESLCLDALQRCIELFKSPIPAHVLEHLNQARGASKAEAYFVDLSFAGRVVADMRSLPPGVSRLGFLKEIFLPSEYVMRAAYPELAHRPLIYLHLRRLIDRLRRDAIARKHRRGNG